MVRTLDRDRPGVWLALANQRSGTKSQMLSQMRTHRGDGYLGRGTIPFSATERLGSLQGLQAPTTCWNRARWKFGS